MYMLDHFDTAKDPANGPAADPFITLSKGVVYTNEEDPCDPVTATYVVQLTTDGYARALSDVLRGHTRTPDEGVEASIADWLGNYFAPATHCHCEHDCCGCRTGHFSVKHLGGAVFLAQSQSSRNY